MERAKGRTASILIDLSGFISDYDRILTVQRNLNRLRNEGRVPDLVILLQHNSVYTTGIHDNPEEYTGLKSKPIRLERGGSVTYHGPGQLVAYFIVSLKDRGINILDMIRIIQGSVCDSLERFQCIGEGRFGKETGVWIRGKSRKIASIGLALKGFCTMHGVAVNVANDLGMFEPIRPCGYDHEVMTSLSESTGKVLKIEEFSREFKRSIKRKMEIDEEIVFDKIENFIEYLNERLSVTAP